MEIKGEQLDKIISDQIAKHKQGISDKLKPFDPVDTFHKWHNILRSIEEFINLPQFNIDDLDSFRNLLEVKIDSLTTLTFAEVNRILADVVEHETIQRYNQLLLMTSSILAAFKMSGIDLGFTTIGEAIGYYQSRRRYFVTILYCIPKLCKGNIQVEEIQIINEFLPNIEMSCVGITTLSHYQVLNRTLPNFRATVFQNGIKGSADFKHLDALFLEPERLSVIDDSVQQFMKEQGIDLVLLPGKKIFGIQDFTNAKKIYQSIYSHFQIEEDSFLQEMDFLTILEKYLTNDYHIIIPVHEFENAISIYSEKTQRRIKENLLSNSSDYRQLVNSYHPFIKIENAYHSNINLVVRFLGYSKNMALDRNKKYQINTGFIFEETVKRDLDKLGYCITDIKRINKKEFDVVTTKNEIIFNFQCKNNAIDLTLIESDLKKFVRYNNSLSRYFEKALEKEQERESLLIEQLGIRKIQHFVVSKFPVITNNKRVIPYNQLTSWNSNL